MQLLPRDTVLASGRWVLGGEETPGAAGNASLGKPSKIGMPRTQQVPSATTILKHLFPIQ